MKTKQQNNSEEHMIPNFSCAMEPLECSGVAGGSVMATNTLSVRVTASK